MKRTQIRVFIFRISLQCHLIIVFQVEFIWTYTNLQLTAKIPSPNHVTVLTQFPRAYLENYFVYQKLDYSATSTVTVLPVSHSSTSSFDGLGTSMCMAAMNLQTLYIRHCSHFRKSTSLTRSQIISRREETTIQTLYISSPSPSPGTEPQDHFSSPAFDSDGSS